MTVSLTQVLVGASQPQQPGDHLGSRGLPFALAPGLSSHMTPMISSLEEASRAVRRQQTIRGIETTIRHNGLAPTQVLHQAVLNWTGTEYLA